MIAKPYQLAARCSELSCSQIVELPLSTSSGACDNSGEVDEYTVEQLQVYMSGYSIRIPSDETDGAAIQLQTLHIQLGGQQVSACTNALGPCLEVEFIYSLLHENGPYGVPDWSDVTVAVELFMIGKEGIEKVYFIEDSVADAQDGGAIDTQETTVDTHSSKFDYAFTGLRGLAMSSNYGLTPDAGAIRGADFYEISFDLSGTPVSTGVEHTLICQMWDTPGAPVHVGTSCGAQWTDFFADTAVLERASARTVLSSSVELEQYAPHTLSDTGNSSAAGWAVCAMASFSYALDLSSPVATNGHKTNSFGVIPNDCDSPGDGVYFDVYNWGWWVDYPTGPSRDSLVACPHGLSAYGCENLQSHGNVVVGFGLDVASIY